MLITITTLPLSLLPAIAKPSCINYWVNPATGKQECLNIKNDLPVKQKSVVDPVRTSDLPTGFEFFKETEIGDRLFIKSSKVRLINGVNRSFPTVITKTFNGKRYKTKYDINCDRQQIHISSTTNSNYTLNQSLPIVVSQPETLEYMIWDSNCQDLQLTRSTTHVQKSRIIDRQGILVHNHKIKTRKLNVHRRRRIKNFRNLNLNRRQLKRLIRRRRRLLLQNRYNRRFNRQFHYQFRGNGKAYRRIRRRKFQYHYRNR